LEEEKANGSKQKTYNGHSRTTEYRRKLYRKNLAAQGYLPIHKFITRMGLQKRELELTTAQDLTHEELEKSSDNEVAAVS
jgi:hypothetical protein